MAKGDANDPQTQQLFQQIQQMVQSGQLGGTSNQTGQITGNAQNFMAGQRKTMGNPNPVNPYGFVPPSQRGGMPSPANPNAMTDLLNPPKYASDGISPWSAGNVNSPMRAPMPSPSMNMPATNTGFMGNQNTGITGGMNKTYAPSGNPNYSVPGFSASGGSGMNPIASTNMGMNMPPAIRMNGSGGMQQAGATGGWSSTPSSNPMNGQQNNPYAPKIGGAANFGATGGSFGRSY